MPIYDLKCPECGEEMYPYIHYYIHKEGKIVEICKECINKRKVRRMCTRIKGKTKVID